MTNVRLSRSATQGACPDCGTIFAVPGTEELKREILRQNDKQGKKKQSAELMAEDKRKKRAEEVKEQIELEQQQRESERAEPVEATSSNMHLVIAGFGGIVATLVLFAVASSIYSVSTESGAGLADVIQSAKLRRELKTCPSYGIVIADVYYDGLFSADVVVFDLLEGGPHEARRIDPLHLLMEFSGKLDLYAVRRVILARKGHQRFTIESSELRELSESYKHGGRIWVFNYLPSSVRTMFGSRVYDEWTGGLRAVLHQQAEDLNDFIDAWTVH